MLIATTSEIELLGFDSVRVLLTRELDRSKYCEVLGDTVLYKGKLVVDEDASVNQPNGNR